MDISNRGFLFMVDDVITPKPTTTIAVRVTRDSIITQDQNSKLASIWQQVELLMGTSSDASGNAIRSHFIEKANFTVTRANVFAQRTAQYDPQSDRLRIGNVRGVLNACQTLVSRAGQADAEVERLKREIKEFIEQIPEPPRGSKVDLKVEVLGTDIANRFLSEAKKYNNQGYIVYDATNFKPYTPNDISSGEYSSRPFCVALTSRWLVSRLFSECEGIEQSEGMGALLRIRSRYQDPSGCFRAIAPVEANTIARIFSNGDDALKASLREVFTQKHSFKPFGLPINQQAVSVQNDSVIANPLVSRPRAR